VFTDVVAIVCNLAGGEVQSWHLNESQAESAKLLKQGCRVNILAGLSVPRVYDGRVKLDRDLSLRVHEFAHIFRQEEPRGEERRNNEFTLSAESSQALVLHHLTTLQIKLLFFPRWSSCSVFMGMREA